MQQPTYSTDVTRKLELTQQEEAQVQTHDGHQDVSMHGLQAVSDCNRQIESDKLI